MKKIFTLEKNERVYTYTEDIEDLNKLRNDKVM